MFSNKKNDEDLIKQLQNRINELETNLNIVANDNGSVIIKQLPNGKVELNGIEIDNNTPVEYYNSSQATYGELTMFRIGKETKQRELDKLIKIHMDEIDSYKVQVQRLQDDISMLHEKSKLDNDTIRMFEEKEKSLLEDADKLRKTIIKLTQEFEDEKNTITNRYTGLITGLEEDIKTWKERYLTINNVTLDGTIITKYGKINENKGE